MNGHIIPNTPIAVDFWKIRQTPWAKIFFLSHCHADHMEGLSSTWCKPIYCSEVTAEILKYKINIKADLVQPLELNQGYIIPLDEEGVERMTVTLIDANHCPGAVIFLFEGYFGKILYTGDFRFHEGIFKDVPQAKENIDILYLDNTYCSPFCVFPSKEKCEDAILRIVAENYDVDQIIIGMRNLGKEKLLVKIAEQNQEWIGVSVNIHKAAEILNLPDVFTTDSALCRIRTEPVHSISAKSVKRWSDEKKTAVIIPSALYTGLSGRVFGNFDNVYIVPYSDHSSYPELIKFVSIIKPKRVIPIVRGNAKGPLGSDLQDRSNIDCFSSLLNPTTLEPVFVPPSVKNFLRSESTAIFQSSNRGRINWKLKRNSKTQSSNMGVSFVDSPEKCQEQNQDEVVPLDSSSPQMEENNVALHGVNSCIARKEHNLFSPRNGETNRSDSTKIVINTETISNNEYNLHEADNLVCSSSQSQECFFDCYNEIQFSGKSHYSTPEWKDVDNERRQLNENIQKNSDNNHDILRKSLTFHKIDIYFKDGNLTSDVNEIIHNAEVKNSHKIQVDENIEECSLVSSQEHNCSVKEIESDKEQVKEITYNIQTVGDADFEIGGRPTQKQTENLVENMANEAGNQHKNNYHDDLSPDIELGHGYEATQNHLSESYETDSEVTDDLPKTYDYCAPPFVPCTESTNVSLNVSSCTQTDETCPEYYTENLFDETCIGTQPLVPHVDISQNGDRFDEGADTVSLTMCNTSCELYFSTNQVNSVIQSHDTSGHPSSDSTYQVLLPDSSNLTGQSSHCADSADQANDDKINQSQQYISEIDNLIETSLDGEPLDSINTSDEKQCITIQACSDISDSLLSKKVPTIVNQFVCRPKDLLNLSQITGKITPIVEDNILKSKENITYGNEKDSSIRISSETRSLTNCERLTIQLIDSIENIKENTSEIHALCSNTSSSNGQRKPQQVCRKRSRLCSNDINSESESENIKSVEKLKVDSCRSRRYDKESQSEDLCLRSKSFCNSSKSNKNCSLQSITSFFRPAHTSTCVEINSENEGIRGDPNPNTTERGLQLDPNYTYETKSCSVCTDVFQSKLLNSSSKLDKDRNRNTESENQHKGLKRTYSQVYSVIPSTRKRTKLDRQKSFLKAYKKFCDY